MEIDANISRVSVNGLSSTKRTAPSAQPTTEVDSFADTNALQSSLSNTPDVRAEAVARGRALVNQDGYPPSDTVKKLSSFLANHLKQAAE